MAASISQLPKTDHSFNGFPTTALDFLRALKLHNSREWFVERKHIYEEQVKLPMLQLVADLTSEMWEYAPDHTIEPKRAVYRINRDTRFSDDKSPYKTHIAAIFPHRRLSKNSGPSFYFNVSPDRIEVAAGIYTPESSELLRIRRHLLTEYQRLNDIIHYIERTQTVGHLQGTKLKRVPRGFPTDHPAQELLPYKQFYYDVQLSSDVADSRQLFDELSKHFRLFAPLVGFLDECLVSNNDSAVV